MMNPMHARRHDEEIQNPFDVDRQPPVRMMKERRGLKGDEEHRQHHRRDAKDHHCKRENADGKNISPK